MKKTKWGRMPNYKHGKYCRKNPNSNCYCIDCGKEKSSTGIRCLSCSHIFRKKNKIKYYCMDCGKKEVRKNNKRCIKCEAKRRTGKNNPSYIDGRTRRTKNIKKQKGLIEHHIYGEKYPDTITLNRSMHTKLHNSAFFFILDKYGKKGMDEFLIWFFKNYKKGRKMKDIVREKQGGRIVNGEEFTLDQIEKRGI